MDNKLMTIKDVAEYMQLSEVAVYRMVERKEIPSIRVGKGRGTIRIVPDELEKYIKDKLETEKSITSRINAGACVET